MDVCSYLLDANPLRKLQGHLNRQIEYTFCASYKDHSNRMIFATFLEVWHLNGAPELELEQMNLFDLLFGKPVSTVNALELNERLKNGKRPVVIDVRQPDEYRTGHIIGAKLIPLNKLHGRMKELPPQREIICVCASGNRSASATRMLAKAGYNAVNMQGGMLAWRRANLSVRKGDAP
jgi:rhodanese-related sulfurtransferase